MARPTSQLIEALRSTADRLEGGATYRWTHMGSCNCGHLAQTLTALGHHELHRMATMRAGDWSQQEMEYCPTSGLPIDDVLAIMLDAGLELSDLGELEKLSSQRVLATLPIGERNLDRRKREDVVRYMRLWAELLERRRGGIEAAQAALGARSTRGTSSDRASDSPEMLESLGSMDNETSPVERSGVHPRPAPEVGAGQRRIA